MQMIDGIRWYKFLYRLPPNDENVVVEDHEGNRAVGLWSDQFINLCDHPIGNLVKWTVAKIIEIPLDRERYFVCYENDYCILLDAFYDTAPLFHEGELRND